MAGLEIQNLGEVYRHLVVATHHEVFWRYIFGQSKQTRYTVYHARACSSHTLLRFGVFTRLTHPPQIPRLQNSGVPGEQKGYVWFVWGYMGISMGISGFPHRRHREMGLPGSQIRGGEDRKFLLQAVGFDGGCSKKPMGSGGWFQVVQNSPRWWFQMCFYVHHYLGK